MTVTSPAFTPVRRFAWSVLLLRALLALGLGIVTLVTNEIRPGIANVIGIYWFLGALLTLRWARAHRGEPGEFPAYGASVAGFSAAVLVLSRGLINGVLEEKLMLALFGTFSILVGILRASGIFRESVTQAVRRSRPEAIVLGLLEVALGMVLIFSTELRAVVVPIVGIWGLVGGSIMLADAIRAWRVLHRPPAATTTTIGPEVGPRD